MNRSYPILFVASTLLTACGQSEPEMNDPYAGHMSDLEARVSSITGQQYAQDGSGMEGEAGYEGAGDQSYANQADQGGTRTLTIHNSQFNVPMAHIELPTR